MKVLAGEIIGHFHNLPSLIAKIVAAPNPAKLQQVLADLEDGGIFRHLGNHQTFSRAICSPGTCLHGPNRSKR